MLYTSICCNIIIMSIAHHNGILTSVNKDIETVAITYRLLDRSRAKNGLSDLFDMMLSGMREIKVVEIYSLISS